MERQLDIFRTKWHRGTKAPPALEQATHIAIADTLRRWAYPHWWWSHIGHGGKRSAETGRLLKRMGVKPGISDFLLIGPTGFHFLELKRPPNKPTEAQIDFGIAVIAGGGKFAVANSYEEAIGVLKMWGCLKVNVHI